MAFIKLSDDTIKQITKAYYLDRTDPNNPVVRLLRTGYRVINGVVEEIFRSILTYTIAGLSATFVADTDEVFSLDIGNDFRSAPPSGVYFGDGFVVSSSTTFDVPDSAPAGTDNNYDLTTEDYDSANNVAIETNGRFTWNGANTTIAVGDMSVEVTLSANVSAFTNISVILYEYDDAADTNGDFLNLGNFVTSLSVGTNTTSGANTHSFTLNNDKQYGFVVNRLFGDTGLDLSSLALIIPTGDEDVTLSVGPPSYAYTITNSLDVSIATGTYTPPGDSDNHSYQDSDIAHGLRDAIISTANTSTNATFTDDWTVGNDSETATAFRSHIHTNTPHDFGLTITPTANGGTNTGVTVNASEHSINGDIGQMLTGITMTDPALSTTIPSGSTANQVGFHLAALHADISYDAAIKKLTTGPTNVITVTDPHTLTFTEI